MDCPSIHGSSAAAPVGMFALPNNSLKLTRRAGPSGMLVLPADEAHNPGETACFRRAA